MLSDINESDRGDIHRDPLSDCKVNEIEDIMCEIMNEDLIVHIILLEIGEEASQVTENDLVL